MSELEEILDHFDVSYRTTSGNQPIKCPVHEDRVASATLNLGKEVFNCHACGAGGDVYSLVMAREGLDFASAQQFVQKITGRSGSRTRGKPGPGRSLPPGAGYRPRYIRKVPARIRQRIEYT